MWKTNGFRKRMYDIILLYAIKIHIKSPTLDTKISVRSVNYWIDGIPGFTSLCISLVL